MKLGSRTLTTCEISADGKAISLGFEDTDGRATAVQFPLDQIGALAMTLPGLIERALRLQFSDQSLRYSYPLGSWKFEQASDPRSGIMTLSTIDGFSVSFSMTSAQKDEIGDVLDGGHAASPVPLPH